MTPQILAIIVALIFFIVVLLLLRKYVLPEKYAITWLVASITCLALAVFPETLQELSRILGVANPLNLIFFSAFFFTLLLLMQISLEVAKTRDELRRALQEIAIERSNSAEQPLQTRDDT